jgi:hypothetical protein
MVDVDVDVDGGQGQDLLVIPSRTCIVSSTRCLSVDKFHSGFNAMSVRDELDKIYCIHLSVASPCFTADTAGIPSSNNID